MWYAMWDAEDDDCEAFERRFDAVCREIGDRGKLLMPQEVAPCVESAPAPAPAPAPAGTSTMAPALPTATATTPVSHVTTHQPGPQTPKVSGPPSQRSSTLELEREELLREARHISSRLASIGASAIIPPISTLDGSQPCSPSMQLSEAFFLECERQRAAAASERQAERERAERADRHAERVERMERERAERNERAERETRLTVAATIAVAILASALLLRKA